MFDLCGIEVERETDRQRVERERKNLNDTDCDVFIKSKSKTNKHLLSRNNYTHNSVYACARVYIGID